MAFTSTALTTTQKIATGSAAVLFFGAGVLHFAKPGPFLKIVPAYLPNPALLVKISGAAELAGAAGLLIPVTRRSAAWGLVALLLAVFPANVYMATHSIQVTRTPLPSWALWTRLPLQAGLIWWVLAATRPSLRGNRMVRKEIDRPSATGRSE